MFPFVMPWDDATPGTVTDVSFLNAKPAGVNGRVIVKDGHFAEANTGQRLRLMGVNFTFDADFPSHEDATKVAAHLAKLGFNIVRIHHHDSNGSPLWDKSAPGHQKFSADGLDRLDFLIAELKKNGIYVNLNLHVSRTFEPADGFPDSVKDLPEHFEKRVDRFDAHMIELQKNFARDYLTHINPYTKLSYAQDPCVAVVEINNENSMVGWTPQDTFYEKLPEPFRGEILSKWNDWLAQRYGTDEALRAAWTKHEPQDTPGADPKTADSKWFFEHRLPEATMTQQDVEGQIFPDVTMSLPAVTPEAWHIQAQLTPLNLEEGKLYAVSFRAKADKNRSMRVASSVLGGDWHNIGLSSPVQLGTDWADYRFVFRTHNSQPNNDRVSFEVGNDTGNLWISNLRIEPSDVSHLVPANYALTAKNFALPSGNIAQETADWTHFLADTERQYSDEMRRYLRQDLKVQANITDSQMSYGVTSSFNREAGSDFSDEHAYWQHPEFPGSAWDSTNWTINQLSMVNSLSKGSGTALATLGLNRVAGKPYAISEYCIPAPNDFQAEMYPVIASYAALQDWDAIYHFDYGAYGDSQKVGRIQGFFALAGNPVKEGFIASSALLFRTAKMAPLQNVTTLNMAGAAPFSGGAIRDEWKNANGDQMPNLLESRFEVQVDVKAQQSELWLQPAKTPELASARLIKSPNGALYVAEGQGALAIAGFVGGQTVSTKWANFTFPTFGNNYAGLILTSAQDPTLESSRRLLLTIGGKSENLNMGWNEKRTSVGHSWGQGPTQAEGIPATITLTNPRIKHVWPLDPTGARLKEVPVKNGDGKVTFTIGPDFRTMHYELGE